MCAGTQAGKTGFGPWWLYREICGPTVGRGSGDYLAVTATFDLFKLKMLPALQHVFCDILGVGRYWAGDRVIELRDPDTGRFKADKSTDLMWGRIILRSADSPGGLESGTVKGAWLDEAGQPRFTVGAWRGIRRRLALHRGRVLVTTTLYDLGWVKSTFIDKAEQGGTKTVEVLPNTAEVERTENESAGICLIQFDSIANPTYPLAEYEEAKETMPDDEFQMFWRGRAARLRYLVYDSFDPVKHTCPRFPIPGHWPRYIGLDFGAVHTAAMFYAEEPGTKRLYCYREYLAGDETAKGHAEAILAGEPGRPTKCVGGSKSEKQWRREFAAGGLPVSPPPISDVGIGINRVYGCHKRDQIIYFDDLSGILGEKATYKKKRDREGNVTDEIADKSKFHCLAGWTPVLTKCGDIPLSNIKVGDEVLTRCGYRRVLGAAMTNHAAQVYDVLLSNGVTFSGTGEHPVWVAGVGYTDLHALRYGDIMLTSESVEVPTWNVKSCNTMGERGEDTQILSCGVIESIIQPASMGKRCTCIDTCGKSTTGLSQTERSSTTLMVIPPTMIRAISKFCWPQNISRNTRRQSAGSGRESTWTTFGIWPQNGMVLQKGELGTENLANSLGKAESLSRRFVSSVAHRMKRLTTGITRDFAPTSASRLRAEPLGLMMKHACVSGAGQNLRPTSIAKRNTVPVHVVSISARPERIPVYNLEVEEAHEYFAAGVLVHNCLDAERYIISHLRASGGWVDTWSGRTDGQDEAQRKRRAAQEGEQQEQAAAKKPGKPASLQARMKRASRKRRR